MMKWLAKAVVAGAISATLAACSGAPKSQAKAEAPPPVKTVTTTTLTGRTFGEKTPTAPVAKTAQKQAKPADFGKVRDKHGTTYAQVEFLGETRVPMDRNGKGVGYVNALSALRIRFTGDHKGVKLGTSPVRLYDRGRDGNPVPYPSAYHWVDGTTVLVTGWNGTLPTNFRVAAYRVVGNREVSRTYLDLDRVQVNGKPFEITKEDGKPETDPSQRRVAWFEVKTTTKRVPA